MVLVDRLHLALFKKILCHNFCNAVKHHYYFDEIRATLGELGKLVVNYQMWKSIKDPSFVKNCQMQTIYQGQWQTANIFLEYKSAHSKCVKFNGVRVWSINLHFNLQCVLVWLRVSLLHSALPFVLTGHFFLNHTSSCYEKSSLYLHERPLELLVERELCR